MSMSDSPQAAGLLGFGVRSASFILGLVLSLLPGPYPDLAANSLGDSAFAVMIFVVPAAGILGLRSQPRNHIGWLMLVEGLLPGAELLAALDSALWAPVLGLVGTSLILLFPDGRLPSPCWRPVGWFSAAPIGYVYCLITFLPGKLEVAGAAPAR